MSKTLICFLACVALASAVNTWTVYVGGATGYPSTNGQPGFEFLRFTPDSLTVNHGDIIHFKSIGRDIHTVTFTPGTFMGPFDQHGAPTPAFNGIGDPNTASFNGTNWISSGIKAPGQMYTVTITAAPGTYVYYCALHAFMSATITVQAGALPMTPATVDQWAWQTLNWNLRFVAQIFENSLDLYNTEDKHLNTDMTTTWNVQFGAAVNNPGINEGVSYFRAVPTWLTIQTGDTVNFVNNDISAHAFVINGTCGDDDYGCWPSYDANPAAYAHPSPNPSVFDGTNFLSSPFLFPAAPFNTNNPPFAPTSFSVKFTKAGTYTYGCYLHAEFGMYGYVTVVDELNPHPAETEININFANMFSGLNVVPSN